nr:PREDICTED: putative ATP-dependent RNA helicase TDRD9 isoform X2 [Anolis carolinensis]|eukprot:XP_016846157.1 PREDICTED: putative ATP-dependent RNA helicase TDRD9 isoform X2 [Anolis carolinensis]
MLKKLTLDQINDWFTIGKKVTQVEFLGRFASAPLASEESSDTHEIPKKNNTDTEYVAKYRQLETEELIETDSSWPPCKPESQHDASPVTCVPVGNYKYPDLPISGYKEQLLSLIENNSVVIIHGSTGSGKSTLLPQFVLDHFEQRSTYCNIIVTQPRKIGASSIARWITKQRSWPLGERVGYQVGLEKVASEKTRLLYATTGILLQKLVGSKTLSEFTHIFIDEVHERTEVMDFLLLVVRKLLRTNSRFVKVILMSATINCQEFAEYFAIPVRNKLYPAYVFEVEGKPHAIEEYYLDDLTHVISHIMTCFQAAEDPQIYTEMYNAAVALIMWFDKLEIQESGAENPNLEYMSERGSVLVFLPGLEEINYMHELLTDMAYRRLQVYPLHSSITLEEQTNVFLAPVPGYRKILLSTNIAESSVTVPDVKYVIDFCLTRTLVCDEDTNYQSLRLCWASKSSCNQRKGRAGRVSKGYCYRLVYKDFWTRCIPETSIPEMMRCPLETTILKVKQLDMGEPRALLATALSPPSICDIEQTILRLKEIGALAVDVPSEEQNPYDGELTFLGRVLADLPVDQHLGKLIVLGHVFGCLDECLIIAAALSLNNFFSVPFRQHFDSYRNKMHFAGNSRSDCIALVDAFKEWQESRKNGKLRHPKDELDWGRSNYIHIKRIREVAELYEELKKRVGKFNIHVYTQPPAMDREHVYKQRFILQVVMAGAFYPNYFNVGEYDDEIAVRELLGENPKTTVVLKNIPPFGYLYHEQLQSLFRQCGQVKSISYDGTKAFIEFSRNPTQTFKVLPAVYLALKMTQLRMQLELNIHSPEEIESKMGRGTVAAVRSSRVNMHFQKHTVTTVNFTNELEKLPTINSLDLSISVTEVVEVGHFWGYRIDDKSMKILKGLCAEINELKLTPLPVRPHPDLVCLAPFTDWEDERYYRAQILYVSGENAEIFYVDYGNRSKVALNLLREIPSHLRELPFQALEFKVRRMRPSAHSLVCGEQWSYAASQSKAMKTSSWCFQTQKQTVRMDLHLSGTAQKKKPALLKCCWRAALAISLGPQNARLIGPFNPYNLKFSSMTRVSRFRTVLVMRESVNSVVVADDPENSFQQILVASSVSINATGTTMLLRETSLMPHIPGLPALLAMLFAPVIELRIDEKQTRYTGVLCGLGWNRSLGTPVFQDHDMELTFDVEIDTEDMTQINILRMAINKLVSDGPNGLLNFGQVRISQLQQSARDKLLSLICKSKPRNVIPPKWYANVHEWNQLKPSLLIDQSDLRSARGMNSCLYQLHNLVLLNA